MADELRNRLIERVRAMPAELLPSLEKALADITAAPKSPSQIQSGVLSPHSKIDWPHAPLHRLSPHGTYLVTAGTLYKQHFFSDAGRLDYLHGQLLELARSFGWSLEAWAVFSNHYHFVGHAPADADNLKELLGKLHMTTAKAINQLDKSAGRQIWHNFWETELTYERSYLARLNYVHQNPVRHGLVRVANQYRWCSAAWFESAASRAQVKTIYGFKIDKIRVLDDFEVLGVA